MKQRLKRWLAVAVVIYLILLALSHVVRHFSPEGASPGPGQKVLVVEGFGDDAGRTLEIAYRERQAAIPAPPTLLLIHGSPVGSDVFEPLLREMPEDFHILAPDFPGHGESTNRVEDGSFEADAEYLRQLLDHAGVERVHLVAYSRSGGPALVLANRHPERVGSLVLLSALGVQEQELLGNHTLNHALHSLQLLFFRLLEETVPHFGFLDDAILNSDYARSFADADQRPLRAHLSRLEMPVLIIHGSSDAFVPVSAAREHLRIVPQSENRIVPGGHLLLLRQAEDVAKWTSDFVRRVEKGIARVREDASPERLLASANRLSGTPDEPESGRGLLFLGIILFLATFASEDLTCVIAGILAAAGTISFPVAVIICFAGILVGDLGIFFGGRLLGSRAVRRVPFRWVVSEDNLHFAREWFHRRGAVVILTSRFLPGSRLAVYFAAGMARAPVGRFLMFFVLAAVAWTPLVVGLAMLLGDPLLRFLARFEQYALPGLIGIILFFLLCIKGVVPLFTHRGRRLFKGRWKRLTRWEFWPPWVFYPPVVAWVLLLGIVRRRPSLFTAVNPAIPAGGIVFESKSAIYANLAKGKGRLAATRCLRPGVPEDDWMGEAAAFQRELSSPYPLVCKPDAGERGEGVVIVRDAVHLRQALRRNAPAPILQEFIPGLEFGVFFERIPGSSRGRVTSITRKIHTAVVGDGRRTLEELILDDDRAVCSHRYFRTLHSEHLETVPAAGASFEIAPLGTHCRGSLFLDGGDLLTPALEEAVNRIFEGTEGLDFGRLDLKCPTEEHFREGRDLAVLEFNGLSSEPTHIYDPEHSLWFAYRTVFAQWHRAFALAGWKDPPATPLFRCRQRKLSPGKTIPERKKIFL